MKYDSFDDKEYFVYGALLGGKKKNFTDLEGAVLYNKDTEDSTEVRFGTPATIAGIAVNQITNGANVDTEVTVSGSSLIGNAAATLAEDWTDAALQYSQRNRLLPYTFDNSSFASRVYHTVISGDTTYAEGDTGYTGTATAACGLYDLIDLFLSQKTVVCANYIKEDVIRKGDIIVYSDNKTNTNYFHATSVAIYIGDNQIVTASNLTRSIVVSALRTSNVVLVARPYLFFNNEEGITITENDIGIEKIQTGTGEVAIPVFVDTYSAYARITEDEV